jgi:hypothetical protein
MGMTEFEGTLKIDAEGKEKILELAYYRQFISDNKGKTCELKIKVLGRKSDPLRRYYFGVVVEMVRQTLRHTGNNFTKDDTHQLLKLVAPSMKREVVLPTGEVVTHYASIAAKTFTNTDMLTYIEEVKQWAAENLDIIIPDPNEYQ